jgi:ABC-2 type transport system permease protein
MVGIFALPIMLGRRGGEKTMVLIDETGGTIGDALAMLMTRPQESSDGYHYRIERVAGPFEEMRAGLNARVQAEEIDGYIVLPKDITERNRILYRARNIANRQVLRDVTQYTSAAVQAERLRRSGIPPQNLVSVMRMVEVEEAEITATGVEGRGAESTFFYAYIVAFLNYFMVAIYGMSVLRSVLEEKTNRISEVMVSSVKASDLMLGKIVGVSGAALLQVGIWATVMLAMTRTNLLTRALGIPPEALRAVSIDPASAALYFAYFILGFLLFAAVFAALGAAITTEQEAQALQMIVMVPLFVPLLFLGSITNEPLGSLAVALGYIPFTAPITMPMRIATAPIPPAQIAFSLMILNTAVLAIALLAGKIYRIGILSTGRRPTLSELGRWLRQA